MSGDDRLVAKCMAPPRLPVEVFPPRKKQSLVGACDKWWSEMLHTAAGRTTAAKTQINGFGIVLLIDRRRGFVGIRYDLSRSQSARGTATREGVAIEVVTLSN